MKHRINAQMLLLAAQLQGRHLAVRTNNDGPLIPGTSSHGKRRAYTVEDARAFRKAVAKRRARNKMARKSRRVNRLRAGK